MKRNAFLERTLGARRAGVVGKTPIAAIVAAA